MVHYATEEGGLVSAGIKVVEPSDADLLEESLALVAADADQLIAMFYHRLFEADPDLRALFPSNMTVQRDKLLTVVLALVSHYDNPEALVPALTVLGRRHALYGATMRRYVVVVETLLGVLREFAGPAWTDRFDGAWTRALTFTAGSMMAAGALPGHMA